MKIKDQIENYYIDILSLIVWVLFSGFLIRYKIKRDIII